MKYLSFRIGDLEVRSCDEQLRREPHTTLNIVRWNADHPSVYVIAYWTRQKEGYELKFVGDRPFAADRTVFWELAEYGQRFLDKVFSETN